jgi:hypothetical protein
MSDPTRALRDLAIATRVLQGDACGRVARDYGLSATRVRQIVWTLAQRQGASALSQVSLHDLRAYYGRHGHLFGIATVFPAPAWAQNGGDPVAPEGDQHAAR